VLYRWADLIEERADELALIETRDMAWRSATRAGARGTRRR
jgi:hypothetical protein